MGTQTWAGSSEVSWPLGKGAAAALAEAAAGVGVGQRHLRRWSCTCFFAQPGLPGVPSALRDRDQARVWQAVQGQLSFQAGKSLRRSRGAGANRRQSHLWATPKHASSPRVGAGHSTAVFCPVLARTDGQGHSVPPQAGPDAGAEDWPSPHPDPVPAVWAPPDAG